MMSDSSNFIQGDPTSSSLFDWSDFLDFNIDEALNVPVPVPVSEPEAVPSENMDRVRKRDPRLVCSNFLAGRVPCACPELDEQLEKEKEEESGHPGKKRARMVRGSVGGTVRCQVAGCEADITELKGYHKRHRVCLQCANASAVVLDGESKRYCQQCGKFHLLSDFDEGRRSCRRKLEWHNKRRRRKSNDSKGGVEKEGLQSTLADDVSGEDSIGKDGSILVNDQIEKREILLEADGHVSTVYSAPHYENIHGDSVASVAGTGEMHMDGQKQNPKCSPSPACCDVNRNTYSSPCPAGRISFKLYDWNPAEFPRRLRLQIFQWLASMPIELEGYIRPGCTILTAFISMPKPMWFELLKEPALCIKHLVSSPGNMLSGRGTMVVHLNDMIFRVTKDSRSVFKVAVKDRAPKLHYIYPSCFEAGRAMEFVACGTDLLQPKFRFLISFAGRYMAYNICVSSLCCEKINGESSNHQLLKITVPQTDMNHFGPAFIEIENQSGLSNFIPILIGDRETCTEVEILQQKFDISLSSQERDQLSPSKSPCEVFTSRQVQFSDFVLDLAWSLKKPASEQQWSSSYTLRLNRLLTFLVNENSPILLERVLCLLKSAIDSNLVSDISDADMRSLRINMGIAQNILNQTISSPNGYSYSPNPQASAMATQEAIKSKPHAAKSWQTSWRTPDAGDDTIPFLNNDVVMNVDLQTRFPRKSCGQVLTRTFSTSRWQRPLVMAVAAVCICCAVCAVVLHPQGVGRIATSIRRCLFDEKR